MKTKELREKSAKELNKLLREKQEQLRDLNFRIEQKQVKDNTKKGKACRFIARIKTILREEELKNLNQNG